MGFVGPEATSACVEAFGGDPPEYMIVFQLPERPVADADGNDLDHYRAYKATETGDIRPAAFTSMLDDEFGFADAKSVQSKTLDLHSAAFYTTFSAKQRKDYAADASSSDRAAAALRDSLRGRAYTAVGGSRDPGGAYIMYTG